ncbi:MAG: DUF4230 domain-containing protein [Saprospiraceae bacterium]|nr:DUF4230 domain-containing protein [Saprospiraceae bacterium]MCB9320662.1 DUF4230 domain-containing protein [Lewinellaceae bacterium]
MALRKSSFPWRLFLLVVLAGILLTTVYVLRSGWMQALQKKEAVTSTVLLERIQKVAKLITVEGHFSEIYDYKDYYWADFSPFRKKALLRIKAKVSMGYDFSQFHAEADPKKLTITIDPLGEPEILSIDHDIDYYDISEGTFNGFTSTDYTRLSEEAKNFIRHQAENSDLRQQAAEQGKDLMDLVTMMVEQAGWKLEIRQGKALLK